MVVLTLIALLGIALPPRDTLDTEVILLNIDESDEEIAERLDELRRRPIDLNTCSADDLMELPFITAAEAGALVAHRRSHGPFTSLESLSAVKGLDAATATRLSAFATASLPSSKRLRPPLRAEFIQRWSRKLERADGFRHDSSGYLGGPNVLQTRIRLSVGKLSARVTLDKDAGEPMRWDLQSRRPGFDFAAGHVQFERAGWIRRIVVGDFSPRFAHGVLLRSPCRIGSAPARGRGGAASLRPYASASESGHFRGIGVEIAPSHRFALTAFASRRKIDAGIDTTSIDDFTTITRRSTGLHRTENERTGRGAVRESAVGAALQTTFGPIAIGAAYFASEEVVQMPLAHPARMRRRTSNLSFSAGGSVGSLYAAAEWAPATGISAVIDVRSGRHSRWGIAMQHGLKPVYLPTSALSGGSSGITRERTDLSLHGRHRLTGSTNFEVRLRHTANRSSTGRTPFAGISSAADALLTYTPKAWLTLTLLSSQRRSEDARVCGTVRCLGRSTRSTLRLQVDYRHSSKVECRVRGEVVRAEAPYPTPRASEIYPAVPAESFRGILLYEEIRLKPTDAIYLVGRLAIFSADDHAARVYTYENDLTYAFSSPSFSGRGRRIFAFLRWKASDKVSLEAKWSSTMMEDVTSIGTGRDRVEGDQVREIRIQLRLSF